MKNLKTIAIALISLFYGCETAQINEEISVNSSQRLTETSKIITHIGDPNRTPDLYIPQFEPGWRGWEEPDNYLGLWNQPYKPENYYLVTYSTIPGGADVVVNYPCWIANGGTIDYENGKDDFVSCRSCDGIVLEQYGDYKFPGMLSVTTFQNGLPVGNVQKQSFFLEASDYKLEYDISRTPYYGYDYMSIPAGTADIYANRAKVVSGKNLVVVEINPDLLITESNYNNNVSVLPLNTVITSTSTNIGSIVGKSFLDLSAIEENKTHPPTNLTAVKNLKTSNKTVSLNWDCPYHDPFYVKHYFTIKKNGIVIADKVADSAYIDNILGGFKTTTYEITTTVIGLGQSSTTSIVVRK